MAGNKTTLKVVMKGTVSIGWIKPGPRNILPKLVVDFSSSPKAAFLFDQSHYSLLLREDLHVELRPDPKGYKRTDRRVSGSFPTGVRPLSSHLDGMASMKDTAFLHEGHRIISVLPLSPDIVAWAPGAGIPGPKPRVATLEDPIPDWIESRKKLLQDRTVIALDDNGRILGAYGNANVMTIDSRGNFAFPDSIPSDKLLTLLDARCGTRQDNGPSVVKTQDGEPNDSASRRA